MKLGKDDWRWADVLNSDTMMAALGAAIILAAVLTLVLSAAGCGWTPEQSQESSVEADRGAGVRTEQNQERGTATAEGGAENVTAQNFALSEGWRQLLTTWSMFVVLGVSGGALGMVYMVGRMRINLVDMLIAVGIAAAFIGAGLGISIYW